MNILPSIRKIISFFWHRKVVTSLLIYSLLLTGWSVYSFKQNQDYINPRMAYLENTIRAQGLDYQDGRGVYCVIEGGCNKYFSAREMIANNNNFKDFGVVNPFGTQGVYNTIALSSDMYNISNYSVSSVANSQSNNDKQILLYGFIGGDKVKFDLNFSGSYTGNAVISGIYFSNSENKTYKVSGQLNPNYDQATGYNGGSIALNEFENDSISGKFNINSDKPQGSNGGNNFGLPYDVIYKDPLKIKKLYGNYIATDGNLYDLYLTQDEGEIDNWKTVTLTGKLYNNNSNAQSVFLKVGDNYYYSKNPNKFKNIPNESEVTITTKIRPSYQSEYYMDRKNTCYEGGCGQPGFNSKELMFNTTEVISLELVVATKSSTIAVSSL